MFAVGRCVMGTWVFVFWDAVRERLLSYARHCRWWFFLRCRLVRQRNRTMVDGSAQSGALLSFSDICWNGGHFRRGSRQYVVEECVCLLLEGVSIAVARLVMGIWVFLYRHAVRERLLSYARHCRW